MQQCRMRCLRLYDQRRMGVDKCPCRVSVVFRDRPGQPVDIVERCFQSTLRNQILCQRPVTAEFRPLVGRSPLDGAIDVRAVLDQKPHAVAHAFSSAQASW